MNFSSIFAKGLSDGEIILGKKLFAVTIFGTAFSLATSAFSNVVIAYERFLVSKGTVIILTILKILASVVALLMGFGSFGIVVVHLAISVITRVIYMAYVLFKLKIVPVFKDFDFKFIKEVAAYSSFILLQMIAGNINGLANQVLLAMFAEGAAVIIGIYGIGAQILQYFKTLGSHFTSVLMPGLVKLVESGADSKKYESEMIRISRIVFMALSLVWTVFAVNGEDFVVLWAGEVNKRAYFVAIVLMFPQMLSYVQGVGFQLLQAMAKHKVPSIITSVSAILNIIITIILIQWNPLVGAVMGGFIALFLCEFVVMTIMYKKLIGISLISYYKGLLKGILPCIVVTAIVGVLFRMLDFNRFGWLGFIINCGVMLAIYGITMLLYGMNDYEKQLIFKPLKKILKKFHIVKDV
jgi:O-antigen/teichoic acid export membrane protein